MKTSGNVKTFNPETPMRTHTMTMDEFASYLLKSLNDYTNSEKDQAYIKTIRNEQNLPETGIFVDYEGGSIGLPVEMLYQIYLNVGMQKLLKDIADTFQKGRKIIDDKIKSDFEKLEENLIVRPLNVNLHHNELKGCIYQCFGDVALTLYHAVSDDGYLITHKVTKEEVESCSKSEEELLQKALANTAERYPAVTVNFATHKEILVMQESFTKEEIMTAIGTAILSTTKGTNGAAALFYPGVVEKIWNVLGEDFIAVFMNTTDVMILDCNHPLISNAQAIASQKNEFGEYLSGRGYLCKKDGSINVM